VKDLERLMRETFPRCVFDQEKIGKVELYLDELVAPTDSDFTCYICGQGTLISGEPAVCVGCCSDAHGHEFEDGKCRVCGVSAPLGCEDVGI